jgi:hypothetical protein
MDATTLFDQLVADYVQRDGITLGKMMSSPALQYRGKVFAFFHQEAMTFKLGKSFDPDAYGLREWSYLNPFKNKPPMRAWVVVEATEKDQWPALTEQALAFLQK